MREMDGAESPPMSGVAVPASLKKNKESIDTREAKIGGSLENVGGD
jgi:hypothetical protein